MKLNLMLENMKKDLFIDYIDNELCICIRLNILEELLEFIDIAKHKLIIKRDNEENVIERYNVWRE